MGSLVSRVVNHLWYGGALATGETGSAFLEGAKFRLGEGGRNLAMIYCKRGESGWVGVGRVWGGVP